MSPSSLFNLIYLLALGHAFKKGQYGIQLSANTKSFGSAIKDGHAVAGVEQTLFESKQGMQGVVTEQWSGGGSIFNESTVISIYVDGEMTPSIQYNYLLGHGCGFTIEDEESVVGTKGPWGSRYVSHEAQKGGLSHRYVIPFTSSIRITVITQTTGTFWYWVHGIYNFPPVVTDFNIQLPTTARLMLYKQEIQNVTNLEFVTMADITNKSGIVLGFTLAATSSSFTYLEGCIRIKIDNDETQFLSSGTEDIFESSYYFDAGTYHDDQVGLTFKQSPGMMSAYKFFGADPMIFTSSMSLIWRSGESSGVNNNMGCPNVWKGNTTKANDYPTPEWEELGANPANVTTYAWVYVYDL